MFFTTKIMIVKSLFTAKLSKSFSTSNLLNLPLEKLGRSSGWIRRSARKIKVGPFLLSLLHCLSTGRFSYLWWAMEYKSMFDHRPSRQAMFKRVNPGLVKLIEALIAKVFESELPQNGPFACCDLFAPFPEVLLQDSTHFKLADELFEAFPGNYSRGKRKAIAKLDITLDLKRWSLKKWELKNFCQNDQSHAIPSLDQLQPGTLLIRDLGYLTLGALEQMNNQSIHFLSRLKNGIGVFCMETGKEINLSRSLPKNRTGSRWVLLGKKRIPVRLVSIPLDQTTIEFRRRKQAKNRNKRLNPSKESKKRLDWVLLITSVPSETWNDEQVNHAYRVRWNIELLFKVWKGNTNVTQVLGATKRSVCRVKLILLSLLLYSLLAILPVLRGIWPYVGSMEISWTKLCALVVVSAKDNPSQISFEDLAYYAQYEKRKRTNIIRSLNGA